MTKGKNNKIKIRKNFLFSFAAILSLSGGGGGVLQPAPTLSTVKYGYLDKGWATTPPLPPERGGKKCWSNTIASVDKCMGCCLSMSSVTAIWFGENEPKTARSLIIAVFHNLMINNLKLMIIVIVIIVIIVMVR